MTTITGFGTLDVRFPTSRTLAGSDAMNPAPDYSAAYGGFPAPSTASRWPRPRCASLRHPAVTAAVVSVRTPEEIAADVSYLSMQIPDELWDELNRARRR